MSHSRVWASAAGRRGPERGPRQFFQFFPLLAIAGAEGYTHDALKPVEGLSGREPTFLLPGFGRLGSRSGRDERWI